MRTYRRRIATVAAPDLKAKVFFMHVPKCGGTSISEALYATVPLHRRVGVVDAPSTRRATAIYHTGQDEMFTHHDDLPTGQHVYDMREAMLITHMAWGTELIHGHILFSDKADTVFGNDYSYVSVLRDPVARVLSNFAHSRHDGFIPEDFDAYLEHYCARSHGLTTLRYFSGMHEIPTDQEDAALAKAKENMEKFSVLGFLDDLPGFCQKYADVVGRSPKIYRYNEHNWPKFTPTPEQRATLEQIMAPEIALWEFAQKWRT